LAGILMVGGWALFSNEGATPLLNQHKGKIKVVSFDPLQSVVAYLRDHIVQSVWTQDYWGWGYQSVTILHGLLMGQTWHKNIPQPSIEVTPAQWKLWDQRWKATSQGVGAAARVWGEKPFTAPGP
jgi:ABC-type sugar transport system substrate-binding protein